MAVAKNKGKCQHVYMCNLISAIAVTCLDKRNRWYHIKCNHTHNSVPDVHVSELIFLGLKLQKLKGKYT